MIKMTQDSTRTDDKFSKIFFFVIPWTVPVLVTLVTYLFYPLVAGINMVWLPILILYWGTIWGYTLLYKKKRGGVFDKERFKPTLKLQGKYLWLQYLLVYGPFIYAIPLWVINYALDPNISVAMFVVFALASVINGPTEEIFWRACMDDAGKNAGISEKGRLIFAPIAFAVWHTAFVIHLFPADQFWGAWGMVIAMTWSSGIIWHWVMFRSGRLVPQSFYHACANFLNIFPLIMVTVIKFYF